MLYIVHTFSSSWSPWAHYNILNMRVHTPYTGVKCVFKTHWARTLRFTHRQFRFWYNRERHTHTKHQVQRLERLERVDGHPPCDPNHIWRCKYMFIFRRCPRHSLKTKPKYCMQQYTTVQYVRGQFEKYFKLPLNGIDLLLNIILIRKLYTIDFYSFQFLLFIAKYFNIQLFPFFFKTYEWPKLLSGQNELKCTS